MTDRKRPSAGFWITVALVAVLVGYPLSFGPACWIMSRTEDGALPRLYLPIGWVLFNSPPTIYTTLFAFCRFGMPPGAWVYVPIDPHDIKNLIGADCFVLVADD